MEQHPVNQRIKHLISELGISARAFSDIIKQSPTNTQNYIGKRNSMPGADYLESIITHIEGIDPIWLTTGKGEPFQKKGDASEPRANYTKINSGNVAGSNKGTLNQSISHGAAKSHNWNEYFDQISKEAYEAILRENELLKNQLQDKERTIQILLKQQS
jgi:hypothetical protein